MSSSTSKIARPAPFTPKRNLSLAGGDDDSRLPRSTTPSLLNTTKKYKAPLSVESRTRNKPGSISVPQTPSRSKSRDGSLGRPKTPVSPRKGSESPFLMPNVSEMDVSRVDPEEALVDFEKVTEAGDISVDEVEALLGSDYGKEDKVLVSVRVRPSNNPSAWDLSTSTSPKTIKLQREHAKTAATVSQDFRFDEVLTGSENKPVYNAVARSHVCAAMDGFNAVIFAYGQTASGKTFTLSGDEDQPGIIPRAMKDVFAYIKRQPSREYLLRCSYLEIYNEAIHDLLAPPSSSVSQPVQIQGSGANVILTPLREEVVTCLKGVHEVLQRGEGNRRTASTDWNERSSRSHSGAGSGDEVPSGRTTPGFRPPTPGGPRLQARGGRTVQTSVLSLIDLAGSEKATSDKERTREGKYINTSLLTLGSVISTLAENSAKGKSDHVPFRNSKLTRMLQPSLSGNARISVIATINPDASAVAESTSTLLFAQRIKKVQLHAQKKEVVDTDALLERYRKEIEELRKRLSEKESDAAGPAGKSRRLSAREQLDESLAMHNLNARIKQLTKLILTSQTVDENRGDESRPASPVKVDFDMSPYQLQQELLAARREMETQATQILSLEAALLARPQLPPDAPEGEKDRVLGEQAKTIRELEIVVKGYEENLGEPLRAVREDVEKEWAERLEREVRLREEKEVWADELVKQLEKERRTRQKLEEERQALAAFVKKFDSLGLGSPIAPAKFNPPMPAPGGAAAIFAQRQKTKGSLLKAENIMSPLAETDSPVRLVVENTPPSLLEEEWDGGEDDSIDLEKTSVSMSPPKSPFLSRKGSQSPTREVLGQKENVPV
ncbi:kinesin-domain-containing protein [Epithele typhae]|uniref:kinesin-domain-containing protein n=1 Tax=Epithele typhae TaxID=378194 RepID=UPI002008053C|nr:kinesin-domain-containing protein [Epithele typhae]KAH9924668.1 kinesin-domain-containing protein [Epithele typhae]